MASDVYTPPTQLELWAEAFNLTNTPRNSPERQFRLGAFFLVFPYLK